MKKGYRIFFGSLCLILAVMQNNAQRLQSQHIQKYVYTHLLNPREHPHDARRSVKPPTWDFFNYQPHFTVMRNFQMQDRKLVNYVEDFDLYTNVLDLGDVIWPNKEFLSANNIPKMIDEMKQRNLYLYSIWGYVPGSGPPGFWRQFELSEETSGLFESSLGDKWLGMEMGEQDGRYLLAYAQAMYPPVKDRFHQYLNFHGHMEELGNDLGNKMNALVAVTYGHYLLKEGLYTMVGAETAQMHPNGQVFYAFNRGAGKQYGVPWFGNASVWNRWGWKNYSGNTDNNGGPEKGTSLSLLKRLLYNHILYNCMVVGFESGWVVDKTLTPIGQIQQSAQKWVRKNGLPGVQHTPVGIMIDFYAGWIFPNYNNILYRVWGNLPYGPGDYLTNNIFNILYPEYQVSSFYHDETGFLTATPYGDVADALLSDAPAWLLKRYPVLVIAGELSGGTEIRDKLQEYIETGGELYITAGSLKNLPGGLAGIYCDDKSVRYDKGQEVVLDENILKEKFEFELLSLHVPQNARTLASVKDHNAVVEIESGKGSVTVFASPFGISSLAQNDKPILQKEDRPLINPFPMLEHVRIFFEKAFERQKLFDAGKDLALVTCRQKAGKYTLGISNNTWNELPLNIVSNIGKIESIQEIPLDQSEKNAIGYLPEGMEKNTIGKSDKNIIAGGDIRIFRVFVDEKNIKEIPHKIPSENTECRILPLRETNSIKREILTRPTFFQHFKGVVVDWKYLDQKDRKTLIQENVWLTLQKPHIWVDFSSGIDLFPNLRLVNNIGAEYEKSMATIRNVMEKMEIIGSKNLIITLHKNVENNISNEDTWMDMRRSVEEICEIAKKHGINVYLRAFAGNKLPRDFKEAVQFLEQVNMSNLKLALNTAVLLESDLSTMVKEVSGLKDLIGVWLANSPKKDLSDRLWNAYSPIAFSGYEDELGNILNIAPEVPVILDALFEDYDQEYLDALTINKLINKKSGVY